MRSFVLVFAAALAACSSSPSPSSSSSSSGGGGGGTTGATSASGSGAGGAGGAATTGAGGAGGAAAGDTWASYAQGFFAMYCVECHGMGNAKRDYSTIDDVVRDKDIIRCGVAAMSLSGCDNSPVSPKQFPISDASHSNPKPSDAERTRIVAWIDGGLQP